LIIIGCLKCNCPFVINFILAGAAPPMGMMRSMQAVGAPIMQPYQQLQAAPIQQQMPMPVPVPQPCENFIS
jgi:hypothetical protein